MSPKQRSTEKDRIYDRTQGLIEDFTFNAFKRRKGYSSLEIARKREALENVLIPYRMTENEEMLHHAGFRAVDAFFKWYNFAGLIALK